MPHLPDLKNLPCTGEELKVTDPDISREWTLRALKAERWRFLVEDIYGATLKALCTGTGLAGDCVLLFAAFLLVCLYD
jgi:hypothetical protein